MDNLGDIFNQTLLQLNKDEYGSYVTPDNFTELCGKVNLIKVNQLVDAFETTREVSTDLRLLIRTLGDNEIEPLTFDAYGYANKPDDYFYFARGEYNELRNICGGVTSKLRMVEYLDQARFNSRLTNELTKPTLRQPIMTDQNDRLVIRPIVPSIRFSYVKQPNQPFFDYDIVDDGIVYLPPNATHVNSSVLPVGTPSRSVEFEYPQSVYPDLVNLLVREYSITLQSQFGIQTTQVTQG
jgi:hypothetical protein